MSLINPESELAHQMQQRKISNIVFLCLTRENNRTFLNNTRDSSVNTGVLRFRFIDEEMHLFCQSNDIHISTIQHNL